MGLRFVFVASKDRVNPARSRVILSFAMMIAAG